MKNAPRFRVLVKSDGGPGRTHEGYLAQSHLDGLVHYPGLPNGTLFQELDQVFSLLKTRMEENRERIWNVNYELDGARARVKIGDFAKILFGGKKEFATGGFIILRNAFADGLSREHLERAIKKCGYVPATRIALKSGKLRHEIIECSDGELDEELNEVGMAETLLLIEKMNHETVEELVEQGYTLATGLKRDVTRRKHRDFLSEESPSTTTTVPGTTAYQRQLLKASTQGKHFKLTNGGAPMNSDDWICAMELKEWDKKAEELEKKKKKVEKIRKSSKDASKVTGNDPSQWTKDQVISKICEKDPTVKKSKFRGLLKSDILTMYTNDYAHLDGPNVASMKFTKKEQRLLEHLRKGRILDYERTGIYLRAVRGRLSFLITKAANIPKNHALALAMNIFQNHFQSRSECSDYVLEHFNEDYDAFVEEISQCNEIDSFSDDSETYYSHDELDHSMEELDVLIEEVEDGLDELVEEDGNKEEEEELSGFSSSDELESLFGKEDDKQGSRREIFDSENHEKDELEKLDDLVDGGQEGGPRETDDFIEEAKSQFEKLEGEFDDILEHIIENDNDELDNEYEEDKLQNESSKIVFDDKTNKNEQKELEMVGEQEEGGAVANVLSQKTPSFDSTNEVEVNEFFIDELVASSDKEARPKLKKLYEQFYGEPHSNPRVRSTRLATLIKAKLHS